MRLILALLLCFTLPAVAQMPGLNPGRDPRLPAPAAHPPWHAVALLEAEGIGICTGAMLAPAVLLTAAHCLKDAAGTALLLPTQIRVTLGGPRRKAWRCVLALALILPVKRPGPRIGRWFR